MFGFFGLDIALLYLAFRLSYRSGRLRETIRVTADEVVVRRIAPNGRTTEWRFNPYWLRVALDDPVEHHSQIILTSHGRSLVIGPFLAPEERASLGERPCATPWARPTDATPVLRWRKMRSPPAKRLPGAS